jgi:hypothetical protein
LNGLPWEEVLEMETSEENEDIKAPDLLKKLLLGAEGLKGFWYENAIAYS